MGMYTYRLLVERLEFRERLGGIAHRRHGTRRCLAICGAVLVSESMLNRCHIICQWFNFKHPSPTL
jgi:hypothetical protein